MTYYTFGGTNPLLSRLYFWLFDAESAKPKYTRLVSDASSRLPWSIHTTTSLNHAELLWDRPLMSKVAGLLRSSSGRM